MKAKRKRHEPQFKARVALEAIKGIKTVQQIAKEFDVHPVQVSDWKKKLNEHASSVFDTGKEREQEDFGEERTALHSKIGELSVQVDFLAKNPSSSACGAGCRAHRTKTPGAEHENAMQTAGSSALQPGLRAGGRECGRYAAQTIA